MPTSRRFARLAVDASPLLSAPIGGRARDIVLSPAIGSLHTAEVVLGEVREYLPRLAAKRGLDRDLLELTLATLPVQVHGTQYYSEYLAEAGRRLGGRDPDDVHLLALTLKLEAPIWSNDQDFSVAGVEWWTTARLMAVLGSKA